MLYLKSDYFNLKSDYFNLRDRRLYVNLYSKKGFSIFSFQKNILNLKEE